VLITFFKMSIYARSGLPGLAVSNAGLLMLLCGDLVVPEIQGNASSLGTH